MKAIALSHPHFYSNMTEWAKEFNCPIFIHYADESYVINKNDLIIFWKGSEEVLWNNMKLINIGGHFPGSSILHVPFLSKSGAIFCGDTLFVAPSKAHISVMYSYPNRIPLPVSEIKRIKTKLKDIGFDTLFGLYSYQNLQGNAKKLLDRSLERYIID